MQISAKLPILGAVLSAFAAVTFVTCAASADESSDAPALETKTPSRLVAQTEMSGRVNPPSIAIFGGAYYRHVITEQRAYVQAGGGLAATPAYVAPQVHVEWMPHPIITLRAAYDLIGFTGADRGLVGYDTRESDFSESALADAEARTGAAHKASFGWTMRSMFGPLLLRGRSNISYFHTIGDERFFYQPDHDTLVKSDDLVLTSRTDILYAAWRAGSEAGLFIGPGAETQYTVGTEMLRQRIGVSVSFSSPDWGPVHKPTFVVEGGGNATDPNRKGQAYAALGFSAEMQ